jgi:AcrR family transcriptional regulator
MAAHPFRSDGTLHTVPYGQTVRYRMGMAQRRLGAEDWTMAALAAIADGGLGMVAVEPLAARLGATKGSFYWHFTDRAALLDALLSEWEAERAVAMAELPVVSGEGAVHALMQFLQPRVIASERGEVPSDASIFAWAATDREVARRVNAAEAERISFYQQLVGDDGLGELLYLAYLGFIMRRRRVRSSAAFFPTLARLSDEIATAWRRRKAARGLQRAPRPRATPRSQIR